MSLFTSFLSCFVPKSSSKISSVEGSIAKSLSSEKPKSKFESLRAPIIRRRDEVQIKEMMEWDNQQQLNNHHSSNLQGIDVNRGGMYVKVITDEQLETLRKQIAIYATICKGLVEMHKTLTSQQDLAGL
ncbi:unnamed protein product [Eruca vesicaria subsp. sativa]|uniref:Uncharacterized protein n=1 Tax=Eruca vesicaria subsp. sativa TaxID=29727 RepID=A0ABC8IPA5_ERUVS|nr:unnamed protein product [Eruca vesicaria subsp. sativa]